MITLWCLLLFFFPACSCFLRGILPKEKQNQAKMPFKKNNNKKKTKRMLKHLQGRRAEKLLRSGLKKKTKKKPADSFSQYVLVAVIKMKKNLNSKFVFCFFRPGCKFCSTDVPWRRHRGSFVKLWEAALMKPAAFGELDGRRWEAHVLRQFILFSLFFFFYVVKTTETRFKLNAQQNACQANCPSVDHEWLFQLVLSA